jgi:transposase
MDDHSDDIRRPSPPRIEVYAGVGRKRWPDELKAQIVVESFRPGAVVTDIARRHGCRPQQVHSWRRMARLGQLALPASADAPSFVPLVSESSRPAAAEPSDAIARGRAGPSLLAMIMFEKFGQHQPLNRQAERYALEGVRRPTAPAPESACCSGRWVLPAISRLIKATVFEHRSCATLP